MKVSTENDNNFGYEKITIVVDNIPLKLKVKISRNSDKEGITSGEYFECFENNWCYMKNIGKYLLTHECITLLEFYTTKW